MRLSEEEDDKTRGFIQSVFGYESQLPKAKFIEIMKSPKLNWIFDPEEIRKKFKHFFDEEVVKKWEEDQEDE